MEPNYLKIFNKETLGSVESFCKLNNIKDIDEFLYLCFKQGFDIKKFGFLGKTLNEGEKQVEIEVIREIRVEVPVERVVEVIKEVEKVVTKIEYICDKSNENELGGKIAELEEEISTKTTEIDRIREEFSTKTTENESFFQNEMSKKDKELEELKNNDKSKLLQETLQNLRGELQQKNEQIRELEKINRDFLNGNQNQGYLMRGSNLNR